MVAKDKNFDKEQKRLLCIKKTNQLIGYAKSYKHNDNSVFLKCSFVCVNSDLFRGCFHPSPVFDLIVGNKKRGRKLKGDILPEKLSHRYLFDANDRLACVENVHQGKTTYVEHLFYTENSRIGITTDRDNIIHSICEEIFENGRIVSVAILSYYEIDSERILCNLHWEEYTYNENGLCACDFVSNFNPEYIPFSFSQYKFEVQDGLLKTYTNRNGGQYYITKKREANGKVYYFG